MTERFSTLDIALIHHPVLNKGGETIGSAVTNLDLHDIARAARTYGVDNYYVATPYKDQHELIAEIVGHWQHGHGASYNPARKEALSIIRPVYALVDIIKEITDRQGAKPLLVTTSARSQPNEWGYEALRGHMLTETTPILLLFGTAHGLAPEILEQADFSLPPIKGKSAYNHLSVRSAVSVILDRLLSLE